MGVRIYKKHHLQFINSGKNKLISVSASQIKSKAEELRQLNGQFKSQVGDLDGKEMSLKGMWEGEANNAFHAAFQSDKTQFEAFYQLIEQYCNQMMEIAAKYEAAENNQKTIIFSCFTTPFESITECVNLKKDLDLYKIQPSANCDVFCD